MCSGTSHLRTTACRGVTWESITCSSVPHTFFISMYKQWVVIRTVTALRIRDFNLGSFSSSTAASMEENSTGRVKMWWKPGFLNFALSSQFYKKQQKQSDAFYQWLWVPMATLVLLYYISFSPLFHLGLPDFFPFTCNTAFLNVS